MDQAWALEQGFWEEISVGNANSFYSRHMAADGFVVLPNRIVGRNELVSRWPELAPVESYALSEPTFTLLEGGNVVITYHVTMEATWLPDYAAYMTALYSWQAGAWALIFRAHTPTGNFPF
jgi:hypothetical protein